MTSDLERIVQALLADLDDLLLEEPKLYAAKNLIAQTASMLADLKIRLGLDGHFADEVITLLGVAEKECDAVLANIDETSAKGRQWAQQTIEGHKVSLPTTGRGRRTPEEAAADRKAIGEIFRTFPRDASDEEKSDWYRTKADDPRTPFWFAPIMRGKAFHHGVAGLMEAVEVTVFKVDLDDGNRKLQEFRLDAIRRRQVISLKNTQLAKLSEPAWQRHIDELVLKYNPKKPELRVASTDGNRRKVPRQQIGMRLRGQMILGVPPQDEPIPDAVYKYAEGLDVKIEVFVPFWENGDPHE